MVMKPDLSTLVDLLNIVVGERERTFSDQELCNEKKRPYFENIWGSLSS
jgi:hypothetical protein